MSIGLFDQCQTKVWKVFSCEATLDAHMSVCTSLRMCKLAIHSPISSEKQYLNSTLDSLDTSDSLDILDTLDILDVLDSLDSLDILYAMDTLDT